MMAGFFVNVCSKVLCEIATGGQRRIDAYLFAKSLTAFVKYPVLKDYNANSKAYQRRLKLTNLKYQQVFSDALELGYVRYEGYNLCLVSKQWEKANFNIRKCRYEKVALSNFKNYFLLEVFGRNAKSQKGKYKAKLSTSHHVVGGYGDRFNSSIPNPQITLSVRSAARLLGTHVTTAYRTLIELKKTKCLILEENRISIDKKEFRYRLFQHSDRSVRYDYQKQQYYAVGANLVSVNNNLSEPNQALVKQRTSIVKHYSYCAIDCGY